MTHSKVDLNALRLRAANGDEEAGGELLTACWRIAHSVGRRFSRSFQALDQDPESFAEDLGSEIVRWAMMGGLARYNGAGRNGLAGFIANTARWRALDELRRLDRMGEREVGPRPDGGSEEDAENPIDKIAGRYVDPDQALMLHQSIEAFAARGLHAGLCLDALTASVLAGYTQQEIADREGVCRETVNKRIKTAGRELRRALKRGAHGSSKSGAGSSFAATQVNPHQQAA